MLVNFDDEELFEEIKSHLGPLINRLIFSMCKLMIYSMARFKLNILCFLKWRKLLRRTVCNFGSELELSEIGYLALYF